MSEGETPALRVGISACLLGERVRYDGGHKRDAFLVEVLGKHVEWVPVCPEMELGLGVPRPPMDLVEVDGTTRLRVTATGEDFTDRMHAYAAWRAKGLASLELVAFHAAHKYALLAHSPKHYETLGHLAATAGRRRLEDVVAQYGVVFATAYAAPATRARRADVLEQMAAFFLRALSDDERAELTTAIAAARRGAAPLAAPLALIRAHVHRLGVAHLAEQVALRPHPIDLLS